MFNGDNPNKVLPTKMCKSRGYVISFEKLHGQIFIQQNILHNEIIFN